MKIYINDIPVKITDKAPKKENYDVELTRKDNNIPIDKLRGKVRIENKNHQSIDELLKIITNQKYDKIEKIDIHVKNEKSAVKYLKSMFTIVEAAGGVVEKGNKILLIFRRKKWDIAKGKLEDFEKKKEGAIREVEEETGVKVKLIDKLCITWHTYIRNNKYVLKKTYWYNMACLDDSDMLPQTEEGIEEVKWMKKREVKEAMNNTFVTIKKVVKAYYAQRKLK